MWPAAQPLDTSCGAKCSKVILHFCTDLVLKAVNYGHMNDPLKPWIPDKPGQLSDSEIVTITQRALKNYRGVYDSLSGAIGYLFAGRHYGWRVMFLVHSRATVAKYEGILGIKSREVFPEETEFSHRSLAFRLLGHATNFWKAVKGETPGIRSKQIDEGGT